MNTFARIVDYEEGRLSAAETVELFQELVSSGLAWKLQGHYGRMALQLIRSGDVVERGSLGLPETTFRQRTGQRPAGFRSHHERGGRS